MLLVAMKTAMKAVKMTMQLLSPLTDFLWLVRVAMERPAARSHSFTVVSLLGEE